MRYSKVLLPALVSLALMGCEERICLEMEVQKVWSYNVVLGFKPIERYTCVRWEGESDRNTL